MWPQKQRIPTAELIIASKRGICAKASSWHILSGLLVNVNFKHHKIFYFYMVFELEFLASRGIRISSCVCSCYLNYYYIKI